MSRYAGRTLAATTLAIALLPFSATRNDATMHAREACPAWHDKLDESVHQALDRDEHARMGVIIRAGSKARRQQWREALIRHGDTPQGDLGAVGAFSAQIHVDDVRALASDPAVQSISLDAPIGAHGDPATSSSYLHPELLHATLGLSSSWTGADIGVAVIDSGIEPSTDFETRISAFYDFTAGGVAKSPYDDYGHGTHVAGTIASAGKLSNSNAFAGIAPKARLIGLKVLDRTGSGRTSDVIAAIEFAIQNRVKLGIDIVNLSLGHPIYEAAATDPLVQAVEAAVRSGIVVVVAAGNHGLDPSTGRPGYAGITSPGNAPSAITVGAFDVKGTVERSDDAIATYSSRGPTWYDAFAKPDLLAPGHRLAANAAKAGSLYTTYPALRVRATGWDYYRLSGTSMASAVTSGVVAQMLEANRGTNGCRKWPDSVKDPNRPGCSISANAVKAALQYTAIRMRASGGAEHDTLSQGAGALNGAGAIELAAAMQTTAQVGRPWLKSSLAPVTTIGSRSWFWSQAIVWGNTILWGDTVDHNHRAWANAIVWGNHDAIVWGNHDAIVWGNTNAVWSDPATWGHAIVWGNSLLLHTNGSAIVWGNAGPLAESDMRWSSLPHKLGSNTLALANPELAR